MFSGKGESALNSSPICEVSKSGEIFLLDPESGKMVVYSHKGSLLRSFKFSFKGQSFSWGSEFEEIYSVKNL